MLEPLLRILPLLHGDSRSAVHTLTLVQDALQVHLRGDPLRRRRTCVPDDSAPLLGPQGFVRGVTPLDLGLTLNLNI